MGEKKSVDNDIIVVRNIDIAQCLVVDYPYFKQLLAIRPNRNDVTGKSFVYVFRKTPELFEVFQMLCREVVKKRMQYAEIALHGEINAE